MYNNTNRGKTKKKRNTNNYNLTCEIKVHTSEMDRMHISLYDGNINDNNEIFENFSISQFDNTTKVDDFSLLLQLLSLSSSSKLFCFSIFVGSSIFAKNLLI